MSEEEEKTRHLITERESLKCTLLGLQAARKAIEEEDAKLKKEEKEAKEELNKLVVEHENIERLIIAKREQSFSLQTELYEVKAQFAHTREKSNYQNELIKRFKQLRDQRGCQAKIMEEGVKHLKENKWNIKKKEKLALLQEARVAYKHEKDTVRELKQTSEKDMEALEDEMNSPIIDFINNIIQSELTKSTELRNVEKSPHRPVEKRRQSHASTTPKKTKTDENSLLRITNSAPAQKILHTPKKNERKGILKETSKAKRRIPPADPYDFSNLMNDTLEDQTASQTPPRISTTPAREVREKVTPRRSSPVRESREKVTPRRTSPTHEAREKTTSYRSSPLRETREKTTPRRSSPLREIREKVTPRRTSPTEVNLEKVVPRRTSPVNGNHGKMTPRRASPTPENQRNATPHRVLPTLETQEKDAPCTPQEAEEDIPRSLSAQETQEKEISFMNFSSAASPEKMMDLAMSSIDAGNDLLNLLGVDTNDGEENGPMFSFLNQTESNSGPFFNFKGSKTNDESSNGGNGFLF